MAAGKAAVLKCLNEVARKRDVSRLAGGSGMLNVETGEAVNSRANALDEVLEIFKAAGFEPKATKGE